MRKYIETSTGFGMKLEEPMDYSFSVTIHGNVLGLNHADAIEQASIQIIDMIRSGKVRIKLEAIPD